MVGARPSFEQASPVFGLLGRSRQTSVASRSRLYKIHVMEKPVQTKRTRPRKKKKLPVAGVTWYTEDNWSRVKAAAADAERFEATYADWNAMAVEALVELKTRGIDAVRIFIAADELLSWCLVHDKPNSAASRAEFVAERLRSRDEAGARRS
jgi:hypothetical protein